MSLRFSQGTKEVTMSNNKQSSIEFLWDELKPFLPANYTVDESVKILSILKQAKAMHKQEIVWAHGIKMKGVNNHKCVSGEQYYNETFGEDNQQAMIDYNKMEEEWEMDNYNEMKDEQQ